MEHRIAKVVASPAFRVLDALLIPALLILTFYAATPIGIGCGVCASLFWLIRMRLTLLAKRDEKAQQKSCRFIGAFLLIPSLGMFAPAIASIFMPQGPMESTAFFTTCGALSVSALMILCTLLRLFLHGKKISAALRFLWFAEIASLSAPIAFIISLSLLITDTEQNQTALLCMTIALFAAMALFISLNLLCVAFCDYKTSVESVKIMRNLLRSNRLNFVRISLLKDTFLVLGKAAISLYSLSFFMFVNALYSLGMGFARAIAIKMHAQTPLQQLKSYRNIGIIILLSSLSYVLYSIRLFFGGTTAHYPMTIALAIALYTFVEFGIDIREMIRLRKSHALEAKALRAISLSSTLLCFVLTQTAILSFADAGDHRAANAISGVLFGSFAAVVGLILIVRSRRISTFSLDNSA